MTLKFIFQHFSKISNFAFLLLLTTLSFSGQFVYVESISEKYNAQIKELDGKKDQIFNDIKARTQDLDQVVYKQNTLSDEISSLQNEAQQYANTAKQARDLIGQYEEQKKTIEAEIAVLKEDIKKIYKDLQIQNISNPIQSLFTAKNLGEAIGEIYINSNLENKANNINKQLEERVIEKENNIRTQGEIASQADQSEAQARSKQAQVGYLLEQTKGEESKYREILEENKKLVASLEEQRKGIKAQAEAEEVAERARQEAERQRIAAEAKRQQEAAKAAGVPAYKAAALYPVTGPTQNSNTGFSDEVGGGKCSYEATNALGVGRGGFFGTPTVGNFEREFGYCGHDGIDISNGSGTEITAAAAGTVVRSGYTGDGYGNNVVIQHTLPNGSTIYTLYAHFNSTPVVANGATVSKGQLVGYMGCSGNCTGPHLHFMIIDGGASTGFACRWGTAKCYRPRDYVNF
jgi:murein DD-endopeptidase MepM/ murein hydrolase activator NlpD